MTWEGVPWAIGGGALHTAEVSRLLAYLATGGGEGVAAPTDCKVMASAIPDGNIHINPGGVGVLNRFPGGPSQSYLLRNVGDEVKAITPQGSSGPRYDLVAVIVKDPQYPGQPAPADIEDGPYLETVVYENVPSTTRFLSEVDADQTGYALARIAMGASDGTVEQASITDLRQMIQPRYKIVKKVINSAAGVVNLPGALAAAPGDATWNNIYIPEWAQRVILEAHWAGIQHVDSGAGNGSSSGTSAVSLGTIQSASVNWSVDATGANKPITESLFAGEDLAVPSLLRGTFQTLTAKLAKTGGAGMTSRTTNFTAVSVTATFYEDVA